MELLGEMLLGYDAVVVAYQRCLVRPWMVAARVGGRWKPRLHKGMLRKMHNLCYDGRVKPSSAALWKASATFPKSARGNPQKRP